MATQWQGPHFLALLAASALAFGAGYLVAGRQRPAAPPPAINVSNGAEPSGFPGVDANGQAPRGRPDENELIARNAEPTEGAGTPPVAGNGSSSAPAEERRARPPREPQDRKPPPDESVEDDEGYDPDAR